MEGRSSSGQKPESDYQVFLSFRGCDTRQGFTDSLYHFLIDAGVRVFRDNEDLRPGHKIEEVLTAINKSIVCIPILSKNYTNSKWCLFELAEMVKLEKDIMPIFYKVEADDVKLKTNLYSDHLSKFGKEYDGEKVEWERALKEVGGIIDTAQLEGTFKEVGRIKAWTIVDHPGYGELCKEVVREVLQKLEVKHKIFDGPLIGIDDHVKAMRKLLDIGSPDVRYIVIHGVGGVGKTTLAKVIFNQLCDSHGGFQRCCFLDNVRETTNHQGIIHLQNKLLRELGPRINEIYNVDSGIKTIKDVVKNKKVLIILDDLDQHKEIESLAGDSTWFGRGSRIIVTTRDPNCVVKQLNLWNYSMSGMDSDHALQLFCRHAFKMESPPTDYLHISKEVVAACGRLPLALEVMGSYLYRIDKEQWKSKIKMIASHNDVQEKLMISFKTLDPRTKQIFLDIACFFVGRKITYVVHMWEACDFHPDEGIDHLLSMSLVKISEDNTLWMHDLIRDLGREIVIQENLTRPEKRSRLWSQKEVKRVLWRKKGTSKTDALRVIYSYKDDPNIKGRFPITANQIRPLQNLRFLELNGVHLEGDFEDALQDLKWLSLHNVEFKAANLKLKDLVILELLCNQVIQTLSQIKVGENLKVLKLSNGISPLAILKIYGRKSGLAEELTILTEVLKNLSSLVELEISCIQLKEIPTSIRNLKNLRVMKMNHTFINELPDSICNLDKLEKLHVVSCGLEHIPEDIGWLYQLKSLDLSGSEFHQLPSTIKKLSLLQHLFLENCDEIKELPNLPSSLTILHVSSKSLWNPPNLSNLELLTDLLLHGSMNVSSLLEQHFSSANLINNCPFLESFNLAFGGITCVQMETSAFPRLKRLQLHCPDLQVIGQLPLCLTSLHLSSIQASIRLPTCLREMEALNCLVISSCRFNGELTLPRNLQTLRIHQCSLPQPSLDLSELKMLQDLVIADCRELKAVRGVENMKFLKKISVNNCTSLEQISNLSKFERLAVASYDFGLFAGVKEIIKEPWNPSYNNPSKIHPKRVVLKVVEGLWI